MGCAPSKHRNSSSDNNRKSAEEKAAAQDAVFKMRRLKSSAHVKQQPRGDLKKL